MRREGGRSARGGSSGGGIGGSRPGDPSSVSTVDTVRGKKRTDSVGGVGRSNPERQELRSLDEQELPVCIVNADHRLLQLFGNFLQQPHQEPLVVYTIRNLELAYEMLRLSLGGWDGKVERREGEGRGMGRVPEVWYRLTQSRLVR